MITVLNDGSGGCNDGDVIAVTQTDGLTSVVVAGDSKTVTFTDTTVFGTSSDCVVKVTATITKTSAQQKNKINNPAHLVIVDNNGVGGGAEYGTSAHHKEISLGRSDVYKIRAIYESANSSTDPVVPQFTGTVSAGTFTKGERIKGSTSGAIGSLINTGPTTFFYVLLSLSLIHI